MEIEMRRTGARAALTYGFLLLVALGLLSAAFTSAPPEAMGDRVEPRLAFIGSDLAPSARLTLRVGFALEAALPALLVPVFLALHALASRASAGGALLATVLALASLPLQVLTHVARFSLLEASARYASAPELTRAGLAAAYGLAESGSGITEGISWVFLGSALLALGGALGSSGLRRWLRWLASLTGGLGLAGGIAALFTNALWPLGLVSMVLLAVWTIGLGLALRRPEGGPAGPPTSGRPRSSL